MIEYSDARALVLGAVKALPSESVPLARALGRTLARDVRAREDIPPFTKATMDGYAAKRIRALQFSRRDFSAFSANPQRPSRLSLLFDFTQK